MIRRSGLRLLWLASVCSLVAASAMSFVATTPASAQVTAVAGSAYGVSSNVSLFGGNPIIFAPTPTVTLPSPAGSTTPVTASAPSVDDVAGAAHLFDSGPVSLSTQGTPAGESVTSTASIAGCTVAVNNGCNAGQVFAGPFTATSLSSTCTANGSGAPTGSTTVNGGLLQNNAPGAPANPYTIPINPAPNTSFTGTNPDTGKTYKWGFNEQTVNPDGSITVTAAHEYLQAGANGGQGDLWIGQVVCGVTGSTTTTTAPTGSTTTVAGGSTTTSTSVAQSTTTTAASTTTTTSIAPTTTTTLPTISVGGSAYGYYGSVSLFGGPAGVQGPAPTVTLPAGGSANPVTDSATAAQVKFGQAIIFEAGPVTVSTQGVSGSSGSVTSSTSVKSCTTADPSGNGCSVGQIYAGPFSATTMASTCTANASGLTASTTISGGQVVTLNDANGNPVTTKQLPNPIPANYTLTGVNTPVNGGFKWVFNEQTTTATSITVNAAHEYLGASGSGPAKGDLIVGHAVCAKASTSSGGSPTANLASTGGAALAATGDNVRRLLGLAVILLVSGYALASRAGYDGHEGGARQE